MNNEETEALAQDLGVDAKVVRQMEGRMSAYDMAFDADVDSDDDTAYRAPAYFLEDQSSDIAREVEDSQWQEVTSNSLHLAMADLDDRSRVIISRRWLAEDNKATLHDLAGEYNISAERIRQIEKKAMEQMKLAMS